MGAQEFPFGVVIVNNTTVARVLGDSEVLYIGGPPGNGLIAFMSPP
jgi:hypothetical protein